MMIEYPLFAYSYHLWYQRVLYVFNIVIIAFFELFHRRLLESFENIIVRLTRLKKWANLWPSKRRSWHIALLSLICGTHVTVVSFDGWPSTEFLTSIIIIDNYFHIHDLWVLLKIAFYKRHGFCGKPFFILYERFELHRTNQLSVLFWKNSVIGFSLRVFGVV